MINDFQECLAMSHEADTLPFWEDVYKAAFPSMVAMINHRQDGWHQRAGIDRSIVLENSKQVLVDEKVRGRNKITGRVYDDISLEYISNDKTGAPGWVCKPLQCDYIAYAIAPLGRCYLLPVNQLQVAWERNRDLWFSMFTERSAKNHGYSTWFLPVPVGVLFPAIGQEFMVQFDPVEYEE
jgi:hypothetical protein